MYLPLERHPGVRRELVLMLHGPTSALLADDDRRAGSQTTKSASFRGDPAFEPRPATTRAWPLQISARRRAKTFESEKARALLIDDETDARDGEESVPKIAPDSRHQMQAGTSDTTARSDVAGDATS